MTAERRLKLVPDTAAADLVETRTFRSRVVYLRYREAR